MFGDETILKVCELHLMIAALWQSYAFRTWRAESVERFGYNSLATSFEL